MIRPEGWTPATLYTHFVTVLIERDKAVTAALAASDKRLDGMNEFRESLNDAQKTFITRGEFYAFIAVAGVVGGIVGHFLK